MIDWRDVYFLLVRLSDCYFFVIFFVMILMRLFLWIYESKMLCGVQMFLVMQEKKIISAGNNAHTGTHFANAFALFSLSRFSLTS